LGQGGVGPANGLHIGKERKRKKMKLENFHTLKEIMEKK
jgi:hypothetical protein